MTNQNLIIIQTIVTAAATIAYIFTYRYLSQKVNEMEKTVTTMKNLIDSQTQIINSIESYKKIYDPEDFTKAMTLKLENQKTELTKFFLNQAKTLGEQITKGMNDTYLETNKELLDMITELSSAPVALIIKQFPRKEQKFERDAFIRRTFPHSANRFIVFCDAAIDAKFPPNDQK